MKTTLYYKKTIEVGQHHTIDPIMEGILSCSLASSRGLPPNELQIQTQYFSSCPITLLEPIYIVLPLLHIKNTHFDSVASVVITKVTSVTFFSQGRKCRMLLTSVARKHVSMMPMSCP